MKSDSDSNLYEHLLNFSISFIKRNIAVSKTDHVPNLGVMQGEKESIENISIHIYCLSS